MCLTAKGRLQGWAGKLMLCALAFLILFFFDVVKYHYFRFFSASKQLVYMSTKVALY